jgi:3-oxoacyl-[acyl-carrier protein] reductase
MALGLAGTDLALSYSTSSEAVKELARKIAAACPGKGKTPKITYHQADLSVTAQVVSLCEEAQSAHGRGVDILVSNAGYGKRITDILDISIEEFDKMYTINLRASFLLVKGVVPHMRQQKWGRIIFISSIAASGGGINGCRALSDVMLVEFAYSIQIMLHRKAVSPA